MTQFLLDHFEFLTPELATAIVTFFLGLVYYLVTAAIHYFDNAYEDKPKGLLINIILLLVKKVLVRIEPGKVGRTIAAKKNPDSITAKRSDNDYWFN